MGGTWCKNVHVLQPTSPKEAKLWSANAHCCQCYHLFIVIHPCDMSKQIFSYLQYVILGICRKKRLLSAYDICWFGVPIILNHSHSEKIFSWSLPDNLFYIVSCDLSFWHLSYSFRACLMSLRICIVCFDLFVLICLFGNSTIQKHYFIGLRWGVAVCICLVCSCLNILGSAWN